MVFSLTWKERSPLEEASRLSILGRFGDGFLVRREA